MENSCRFVTPVHRMAIRSPMTPTSPDPARQRLEITKIAIALVDAWARSGTPDAYEIISMKAGLSRLELLIEDALTLHAAETERRVWEEVRFMVQTQEVIDVRRKNVPIVIAINTLLDEIARHRAGGGG